MRRISAGILPCTGNSEKSLFLNSIQEPRQMHTLSLHTRGSCFLIPRAFGPHARPNDFNLLLVNLPGAITLCNNDTSVGGKWSHFNTFKIYLNSSAGARFGREKKLPRGCVTDIIYTLVHAVWTVLSPLLSLQPQQEKALRYCTP